MASTPAKIALFDAFASAAQALGSGRRAEIVDLLAQGERSVEEIAGEIAQSAANTSQHLHVLARAGLVSPTASMPTTPSACSNNATQTDKPPAPYVSPQAQPDERRALLDLRGTKRCGRWTELERSGSRR